ncbi:hypothetical protein SeLEV6574_g04646 [Synchytrium endobioticum]|uniref:Uncharacterized protein n=1 Tax=Synchytrium endobioticum TaxID=286115 RepID=A0A507CYH0_9FUNG|nr:hypothetical protein SeLEV6574_g04646 [Synchytrium endobioticum]
MSRYERIADVDHTAPEDEPTLLFERTTFDSNTGASASSSSSTLLPHAAASKSPKPAQQAPIDGVFGNLAAKPDAPSSLKDFQELEPPSYNDVCVSSPAPPYMDTTVITPNYGYGDDGDVLVEGMPVGNFFAFFINLMVSMSFDFIGFLLTSLLATSHAARCGSRSGLGITLIRYGFLLKSKALADQALGRGYSSDEYYDPANLDNMDEGEIARENEWMSYILIVVGFFVVLRANAEYVRIKRMSSALLSSSDLIIV